MTKRTNGLSDWVRVGIQAAVFVGTILLAYGGLDKRLAIIETKMVSLEASMSAFATQAEMTNMRQRVERLERFAETCECTKEKR